MAQEKAAWRVTVLRRLRARDACECDAWKTACESVTRAVRENRDLRASNARAEAEVARLTRAYRVLQRKLVSQPRAPAAVKDASVAVEPRPSLDETSSGDESEPIEDLLAEGEEFTDPEAQQLRQNLIDSRQKNSELADQKRALTNEIMALESDIMKRDDIIADRDAALAHAHATQKALEKDVGDKELTLEVLHEELRALQTELESTEGEARRLRVENDGLIQRWLEKNAAEAAKLNEVNELYDEVNAQKDRLARERRAEEEAAQLEEKRKAGGGRLSFFDRLAGAGASSDHADARSAEVSVCPKKGVRLIEAHSGECQHVAFPCATGSTIATCGSDREIHIWDAHSCLRSARPTPKTVLRGHAQGVLCIDFASREDVLVSASADNTVRVWSAERCKHTLTGHIGKVTSAHFASADNSRVISGSHDRSLKVWDLTKGYCVKTIFCYSSCNSVGVSKDGRMAVSGHFDNSVRFWDTKSGDSTAELTDIHTAQVTSCAFFPLDDRYVLTNARDHKLALIDTRMSRLLRTFSHENYRNGVNWNHACFSPDGEYVVAGGADGGLFVWEMHTGDLKTPDEAPIYLGATQKVKHSSLTCVAWSPDGLPAAAVDKSGHLRIYE